MHRILLRDQTRQRKAISTSYYDISDDSGEAFTPKRSRGVYHGDIKRVNSQINGL